MQSGPPQIVHQLMHDHRNMARLLDVLEEELEHYKKTKAADFEILSRIVDYVLNFPELRHHPREDLVFRRLMKRDPGSAPAVEALVAEHRELAAMTRKFSAAVHNLWHDVEMPRLWFETIAGDFINRHRNHMREEEEVYFPLALKSLSPADWQEIEAVATQPSDDPLFGGKSDAQYQSLHDRILRLAR